MFTLQERNQDSYHYIRAQIVGKTEVFSVSMFIEFTFDEEDFLKTQLGFSLIYFQKTFFPTFELLNSGWGLSAGAAYPRVFTVSLL